MIADLAEMPDADDEYRPRPPFRLAIVYGSGRRRTGVLFREWAISLSYLWPGQKDGKRIARILTLE
jgi:hypothetical protein